ncbi:hypothetical protein [Caldalkalibacillus salinus]|uniref:hypothetical protein n=1 Tax=Caldalkalibacillus salinus TaxID=2803787 RepID=UPI0019217E2A|nr:hypothetical protein [Caldalkalibacillus salinus]
MKKISKLFLYLVSGLLVASIIFIWYFTYIPQDYTRESRDVAILNSVKEYKLTKNDIWFDTLIRNLRYDYELSVNEFSVNSAIHEKFPILITKNTKFYKITDDEGFVERKEASISELNSGDKLMIWSHSSTTFGAHLVEATEIMIDKTESNIY